MTLSAVTKNRIASWGRTCGLALIGIVGVCLALYLPSCSLFTPPKTTSPYTDKPATEFEILLQREAHEAKLKADLAAEELKRKSELERLTREQQSTLTSLKRAAEASLKATELDQEKERVLLTQKHQDTLDTAITKYDELLSTRREQWLLDDAKRVGDQAAFTAKYDAAIADLELQREQRGVIADILQTAVANIPGVNNIAIKDQSGQSVSIPQVLAGLFGVGGTLGAVFYGRRAAKNEVKGEVKASESHDEAWEEAAKVTNAARDREDAAWEDGFKRAQMEAQNGMLMQALAALTKAQAASADPAAAAKASVS